MRFLEALKRKMAPMDPTEAQIARIAAKTARSFVARDATLLTPQIRAKALREISEAEQVDIARVTPPQEF